METPMSDQTPDLQSLLELKRPPEVVKARVAEQRRRRSKAFGMASVAMSRLHPEDYKALLAQARAAVDAERGPLPGDEP
jgi:hypothetical protein